MYHYEDEELDNIVQVGNLTEMCWYLYVIKCSQQEKKAMTQSIFNQCYFFADVCRARGLWIRLCQRGRPMVQKKVILLIQSRLFVMKV